MSVTFFIAIALSAMSAVTEIQVTRPRLAHVQIVRAERREVMWRRTPPSAVRATARLARHWADEGVRPHERFTAATPRAPAC